MPSSVTKHTIPPFYACYFLRSLASPGITYIGSTPAPPRRKRQHNGDLTQGAHKTVRARPWEMECIVYGFSSKIAALQFEWAWAKPNLSRHLKFSYTEYSVNGSTTDTTGRAGKSLFPSNSMTPGQTRWGKPKRRIARPPSTPNARLLSMRALLRSEPFCGWGLKLAFFTEWSWLAYQRLEAANAALISESASSTLRVSRSSRSGKALAPLYPMAICDFAGVDGRRVPLVHVSAQHQADAGLADQPVKKRQSSSSKKADADDPPQWPETLPRSANLKGLDACLRDFATFPSPQIPALNIDVTKKAKRTTKASKKAVVEAEDDHGAEDEENDDLEAGSAALITIESDSASKRPLNRMKFDDLDLEESEWKRFESAISFHLTSASIPADACQAMNDFMQICVQRYIAEQDARTKDSAIPAPTTSCSLCNEVIDLSRQLDFVLCPDPHASTLPVDSITSSNTTTATVSSHDSDHTCNSVFHLSCLASSFLEQRHAGQEARSSANTVLPTHGCCPCHSSEQKGVGFWADVIRAMYRRHERFERLLQFLARSGKTLAEHLHPPALAEMDSTTKAGKPKRKAKSAVAAEEAEGVVVGEKEVLAMAPKPARAKKRSQPIDSNVEAANVDASSAKQAATTDVGSQKVTKRKVARKAKKVESTEVIDLT